MEQHVLGLSDLKADLADFPITIARAMWARSNEQRPSCHIKEHLQADICSAFDWTHTTEGRYFWNNVILNKKFETYFAAYPRIKIYEGDICGDIEGFPEDLVRKMLQNQLEQTGIIDIAVFVNKKDAHVTSGGFSWEKSIEGRQFWIDAIRGESKKEPTKFKGFIAEYPPEIVEEMLHNQFVQGNPKNVSIFEENPNSGRNSGGFTWGDTPEGSEFWSQVISSKNFDIFFERYPKSFHRYKKLSSTTQTYEVQRTPDQGQGESQRGGSTVSGRRGQAAIGVGYLGKSEGIVRSKPKASVCKGNLSFCVQKDS